MPRPKEAMDQKREKDQSKLLALPPVTKIRKTSLQDKALELLAEGSSIAGQLKELSARDREIKQELVALAKLNGLHEGYRAGSHAVTIRHQSRSTLSKEKLLDNGVEPDVILQSMETTEFDVVQYHEIEV